MKNIAIATFILLSNILFPSYLIAQTTYHVSINTGNDKNPGSAAKPLKSISAAATKAHPGDMIMVHDGTYRERINPPIGGESESKRITYQAAPGEKPVIKGSEIIKGWKKLNKDTWRVAIPNNFFKNFNPYIDTIRGDWFDPMGRHHHTGEVYLNENRLLESATFDEVLEPIKRDHLWFSQVNKDSTILWAQFKDTDPNTQTVEVNVRQTIFYPEKTGINYITVSGFIMRHAATPWAPPTAEQIGLIGTNWSKGWIIENNEISDSKCSGIALGKYGDEWDNKAESAEGYVGTINRALKNGWNKNQIGHHIVRNNLIYNCEQAGIVGSLGCAFSTVIGNIVHDIHIRRIFTGAEMGAIKFHGAIDVTIADNLVYHNDRGIWLDWMAQGTRVSNNLLFENRTYDLFLEVDHGPFVIDNNIFLSPNCQRVLAQGGVYAHNLFAGFMFIEKLDNRLTPFLKAHSTELAGLVDNPPGDFRYYNNIFTGYECRLNAYDYAPLPVWMDGNVFLNGARPCDKEASPIWNNFYNPQIDIITKNDGLYLSIKLNNDWRSRYPRKLINSALLGKAIIADLPFEDENGKSITIDKDYFGNKRNDENPFPGPFENFDSTSQFIKVWPRM